MEIYNVSDMELMSKLKLIAIIAILCCGGLQNVNAQRIVAKSNLLYWCTGTVNAGLEFRVSRRFTVNLEGQVNPLAIGDKSLKHYAIQPEVRYWPAGRPQARWFYGIIGSIGRKQINITGTNIHTDTFGGGISGGYVFVLGKRLSLETTLALGGAIQRGKEWDGDVKPAKNNISGLKICPLKAGVTLTYILK